MAGGVTASRADASGDVVASATTAHRPARASPSRPPPGNPPAGASVPSEAELALAESAGVPPRDVMLLPPPR